MLARHHPTQINSLYYNGFPDVAFPSLFGPVDPKLVQEFSPYGIIYEGTSGSWLIDLTKMPVALQTAAQTSKAMIVNQFDPNDFVGLPGLMGGHGPFLANSSWSYSICAVLWTQPDGSINRTLERSSADQIRHRFLHS